MQAPWWLRRQAVRIALSGLADRAVSVKTGHSVHGRSHERALVHVTACWLFCDAKLHVGTTNSKDTYTTLMPEQVFSFTKLLSTAYHLLEEVKTLAFIPSKNVFAPYQSKRIFERGPELILRKPPPK
jgi:hypothetical protein